MMGSGSGSLRGIDQLSFSPKEAGSAFHVASNACRRPSGNNFDVVRHAVVTVIRVQPSHGDEVVEDVVGQAAAPQLLVTPVIERHVDIGYGSPQSGRVF